MYGITAAGANYKDKAADFNIRTLLQRSPEFLEVRRQCLALMQWGKGLASRCRARMRPSVAERHCCVQMADTALSSAAPQFAQRLDSMLDQEARLKLVLQPVSLSD